MNSFKEYPNLLKTSNKYYLDDNKKTFGEDGRWLTYLCMNCGYPRGMHYPRNGVSYCPTKSDKESYSTSKYYYMVTPEFRIILDKIKVI